MSVLSREAFEWLEKRFTGPLVANGFSRTQHEYDGPFGSHFVDLALGECAYRLISDGRESAVFLDFSAHYYRAIQQQEWHTLLHWPFPPSFTAERIAALAGDIEHALQSHAKHNVA